MSSWISVRDRLPDKDGSYIVASKLTGKYATDGYDVMCMNYAKTLYKINALFPEWNELVKKYKYDENTYDGWNAKAQEEYKKLYDRPGFYFKHGYGEATDVGIDSYTCNDELVVYYWMPFPDPPSEIELNIFNEEETYNDCAVQILKNNATGQTSIGWWKNNKENKDE